MDHIQVDILGLSTSSSSGGAYALVLGELEGSRRLPIIIGAFEAQAIALELEKIQPPRPMTHDLLRDVLDTVGSEVLFVLIDELRDGTFFAKVQFVNDGEEHQLDCRPSDAVALAVRVDAPIYVHTQVMSEAGIPTEGEGIVVSDPEQAEDPELSAIDRMKDRLQLAVKSEDYELAAKLRDEIARHEQN